VTDPAAVSGAVTHIQPALGPLRPGERGRASTRLRRERAGEQWRQVIDVDHRRLPVVPWGATIRAAGRTSPYVGHHREPWPAPGHYNSAGRSRHLAGAWLWNGPPVSASQHIFPAPTPR
jgi:hypothetical protein